MPSKYGSNDNTARDCVLAIVVPVIFFGLFLLFAINRSNKNSDSSSSPSSVLDSSLRKAGEGRAMEMTSSEMYAFRIEQQRISSEHKVQIIDGLTPEEKALRDYEDRMILQGETQSNPYYEELQRKANESR